MLRAVVLANALDPILSQLDGMMKDVMEFTPSNARSPIVEAIPEEEIFGLIGSTVVLYSTLSGVDI